MHDYRIDENNSSYVFGDSYVGSIYQYLVEHMDMNLRDSFREKPTLNEFLNAISYPKDRNVNFDMIIYYVRDNRELVEFRLL